MRSYFFPHINDIALLAKASACAGRRRIVIAEFIAIIAEIEERRVFVRAGFSSMLAYCMDVLGLTEECAKKYIRVGRLARRYPVIFEALAAGRLHASSVILLAPHLIEANAEKLLQAAMGKTRAQLEEVLAAKFPRTEELPLIDPLPALSGARQPEGSPGTPRVEASAATRVAACNRVAPIAPTRFAIHCSIDDEAHNDLRELQELLSHQLGPGDVGVVVGMALKSLLRDVRKRKFGATDRPQAKPRPTRSARHIPAHVRRAVSERDGGQCTFVSEDGTRCSSRERLEFDHMKEVARGGEATVDNIRQRCRAHNRCTAEDTFGAAFMQKKIEEAQRAAAAQAVVRALVPPLTKLGFKAGEARLAAEHAASVEDATMETRFRMALAWLRPRPQPAAPPSHATH